VPHPLVDTNVVLRHLLQDHPDHSPRATAFFMRVASGEITVQISDTVLVETVFTLERSYGFDKETIRSGLLALLDATNVLLPTKGQWRRILDIYADRCLPLGDAQQLELMHRLGITEIISFDKDFDALPGITRIEP
jgi:predicted nucleic acid-binding protein